MLWFFLMLIAAIALCSWLSPPGSSLNRAAWQALDSTVAALSQGDEEDEGLATGRQPGQPLSRLPGCLPHKPGPGSNRAGGQPGEFHHHGSEASTGQFLSRRLPRLLHLGLGVFP